MGAAKTEYIWAGGLLMHQNTYKDGYQDPIAWSYDAAGTMLGFAWRGGSYFYIRNLQGDVVAIHDAAGNVVARYEYDAWGNQLTEQIPGSIGEKNPIRYRGYYYDTETGYYYCQSRYYNPEWCRWISADVYMDTGDGIMGTNMYAYCQNDPVDLKDDTGTIAITTLIIIGVGVLGAVGGGFGGNAIANKQGAVGWEKVAWIAGGSVVGGGAGAGLGYFVAPALVAAAPAVLAQASAASIAIGTTFGKLGTVIANNGTQIVNWANTTAHGLQRMTERGVTQEMVNLWVRTGVALEQSGGKILYVTPDGAAVIDKAGQLITAYTSQLFDANMLEVIKKLFG